MRRTSAAASQQILDQASATQSLSASQVNGVIAKGTVFPLLPHQSVAFYNISLYSTTNSANSLSVQAASVFIALLDAQNNPINTINSLVLAAESYGQGTLLNGNATGATLSNDGDPIMELVSNFTVVNNQTIPAAFQIWYAMDWTNTDGAAGHSGTIFGAALLSFVDLR